MNLTVARVLAFLGAGVLMGVLAFAVTAVQPLRSYLGPAFMGPLIDDAGFDPWTGMGHGRVYEMVDVTGSGPVGEVRVVREPGFPTWLGTRHAIPVPLGIVAAWIALAMAIGARRAWGRRGRNTGL